MTNSKAVAVLKALHGVSAVAVLALALLIVVDVIGRGIFSQPVLGTPEIVKNSLVSIVFMQVPLAVYRNAMLRTTIVDDFAPAPVRVALRCLGNLLGFTLFAALVYASWEPLLLSWEIQEYDGEGALHVPVYPARFIVLVMSATVACVHLALLIGDLRQVLSQFRRQPASTPLAH